MLRFVACVAVAGVISAVPSKVVPPIVLAVCKAVAVSAFPVRLPVTLALIAFATLIVSTYRYAHLFVLDPKFQVEPVTGMNVFALEDDAVKLPLRSPLISVNVPVTAVTVLIYPYAHLLTLDPRFQVLLAAGTIVFALLEDATKLPLRSPLILSIAAAAPTKLSA